MIASFLEGIEHSLDDKQISSLADRLPGWSGSDIQVCLPEVKFRPNGELKNRNRFINLGRGLILMRPFFLNLGRGLIHSNRAPPVVPEKLCLSV